MEKALSKNRGCGTLNLAAHERDAELLSSLLESIEKGWEPFWAEYSETIRWQVRRSSLPVEEIPDLLQEISFKLIKEDCRLLRGWDAARGSMRAYLSTIAASMVKDYQRGSFNRYRQLKVPMDAVPDPIQPGPDSHAAASSPSPRDWAQRREAEARIKECIEDWALRDGLKPIDKTLLQLRLSGLKFREIASAIGETEECTMTRFCRLKPRIRAILEEKGLQVSDWSDF